LSARQETDIKYTTSNTESGTEDLYLDVVYPEISAQCAGQQYPLVLLVHGGGFLGGSKSNAELQRIATDLAEQGFVVAAVNYRLNADGGVIGQRYKPLTDKLVFAARNLYESEEVEDVVIAIEDVVTAFNWLHTNVNVYGIDKDKTVLYGVSAGALTVAHMAAGLEAHTNVNLPDTPPEVVVLNAGTNAFMFDAELFRSTNAAWYVAQGTADSLLPLNLNQQFNKTLDTAGVTSKFTYIKGARHTYSIYEEKTSEGKNNSNRYVQLHIRKYLIGDNPLLVF
jgi:dienelactone hydrolase